MNIFLQRTITALIFGTLFWSILLYTAPIYFSLTLAGIGVTILLLEWRNFMTSAMGSWWLIIPLYLLPSFTMLILLNQTHEYRELLSYLFFLVFSYDMGSYLVGSLIGRTKLAATISPGKTWEGVLGGFLITLGSLWATRIFTHLSFSFSVACALSASVSILALAGDLFESWLKRKANIKDSGTLLPGHGGFFDRFDSSLPTAILFYLLKTDLITLLQG